MKLLLDENLSHRIIPALKQAYPDSSQVSLLGLNEADDHEIWNYAKMEAPAYYVSKLPCRSAFVKRDFTHQLVIATNAAKCCN